MKTYKIKSGRLVVFDEEKYKQLPVKVLNKKNFYIHSKKKEDPLGKYHRFDSVGLKFFGYKVKTRKMPRYPWKRQRIGSPMKKKTYYTMYDHVYIQNVLFFEYYIFHDYDTLLKALDVDSDDNLSEAISLDRL